MKRCSISGKNVDFTLPNKWSDLSDKEKLQLYKIMMLKDMSVDETLTLSFVALTKIVIRDKISEGWLISATGLFKEKYLVKTWQLCYCIGKLKWIADLPKFPTQVTQLHKHKAVDPFLRDVTFLTYLTCDNYYQLYIKDGNDKHLAKMAKFLYGIRFGKLKPHEAYAVFYWWFSLKCFFAAKLTYLFSKTEKEGASANTIEDSVNSLVRVLTGGDITKQQQIYDHNAYSALIELNEKARDVYELKQKIKK